MATQPRPWNEIAGQLDPLMSEEQYNSLRDGYFSQVIRPKLSRGADVEKMRELFRSQTQRKPLVPGGFAGRLAVKAGVAGATLLESLYSPLRIIPGARQVPDVFRDDLSAYELLAKRDDIDIGKYELVGSLMGMVVPLAGMDIAAAKGVGMGVKLLSEALKSKASVQLAQKVLASGLSFAAYEVASKDSGSRAMAGLWGFGLGATAGAAFGGAERLWLKSSAKRAAEKVARAESLAKALGIEEAEGLADRAHAGLLTSPEANMEAAAENLGLASNVRKHGVPFSVEKSEGLAHPSIGLRVKKGDSWAEIRPIEVRPGGELDAFGKVRAAIDEGLEVSTIRYGPEHEETLSRFLKYWNAHISAAHEGNVVLRTAEGQAQKIADQAIAEGLVAVPKGKSSIVVPGIVKYSEGALRRTTILGLKRGIKPTPLDFVNNGATAEQAKKLWREATRSLDSDEVGDILQGESVPPASLVLEQRASFLETGAKEGEAGLLRDIQAFKKGSREGIPGVYKEAEELERAAITKLVDFSKKGATFEEAPGFGVAARLPGDTAVQSVAVQVGFAETELKQAETIFRGPATPDRARLVQEAFGIKAEDVPDQLKHQLEPIKYGISGKEEGLIAYAKRMKEFWLSYGQPSKALGRAELSAAAREKGLGTKPLGGALFAAADMFTRAGMDVLKFSKRAVMNADRLTPNEIVLLLRDAKMQKQGEPQQVLNEWFETLGEWLDDWWPDTNQPPGPLFKIAQPLEQLPNGKFKIGTQTFDSAKEAVLSSMSARVRPGGIRLQVPKGVLPSEGASLPQIKGNEEILEKLGIDVKGLPTDLPISVIAEGEGRSTTFHEKFHRLLDFTGLRAMPLVSATPQGAVSKGAQTALTGIARGLFREGGYSFMGPVNLFNEAFTHAAEAVRMNDQKMMAKLVKWDGSAEDIREAVRYTSLDIRNFLEEGMGSYPERQLHLDVSDLIRRTSPENYYNAFNALVGKQGALWYDEAANEWMLNGEKAGKSIEDVWTHIANESQAETLLPNHTYFSELKGVKGPLFKGPTRPPSNTSLPIPEQSISDFENPKALMLAASQLHRPFYPWISDVDTIVNKLYRPKGIRVPLAEAALKVRTRVQEGEPWMISLMENARNMLKGIPGKKTPDIFEYLSYKSEKAREEVARAFKLGPKELATARMFTQWAGTFKTDTGIDLMHYIQDIYPRLRNNRFGFNLVWGKAADPKAADMWEKMIRYNHEYDPTDTNLGRFLSMMIRKGYQKKVLGNSLDELKKVVEMKTADGRLVLGPYKLSLNNYIKYMGGHPDASATPINSFVKSLQLRYLEGVKAVNKHLPAGMKLSEREGYPTSVLNKMILANYVGALGGRPAVAIRDAMQNLLALPIVGPKRWALGVARGYTRAGWDQAEKAGALMRKTNIGELWGDISSELPIGERRVDQAMKLANKILYPSRFGHNLGRGATYHMEFQPALDEIKAYRKGAEVQTVKPSGVVKAPEGGKMTRLSFGRVYKQGNLDSLMNNTSLAWFDKAEQTRLLKLVHDPGKSSEDVAKEFALQLVNITQWNYGRGAQPYLLRTTMGRFFGQFGVWPANYIEYSRRLGKMIVDDPKRGLKAGAYFVASQYGIIQAFEHVFGADTWKWFLFSPAGYMGSPHAEFIKNLAAMSHETPEGRKARKDVLEYPLDFVPFNLETRAVLKALDEDDWWQGGLKMGPSLARVMGFKPAKEIERDFDLQEWIEEESGFKQVPGEPLPPR
jgi:hypothetical protein